MLRYIRLLGATVEGARVIETGGVLAIASDLPISNGNQVLVTSPVVSASAMELAIAWMRGHGRPFRVTLRDGHDDALHALLEQLGFRGRPWAPAMALHPVAGADGSGRDGSGRGSDLAIERVTDAAGLAAYHAAMGPAYGVDLAAIARVANPRLAADPSVTLYLGRAAGTPVATGMSIVADGVAGVYFIGTVPDARGRGYGEAITARIGADTAAVGCRAAILQSSALGFRVYERLGYRTAFTYQAWTPDPA